MLIGAVLQDGDLDIMTSSSAGGSFTYYQSILSLSSGTPTFTQQTGAANPLGDVNEGSDSAMAFGDIDGDGDDDVLIGNYGGSMTLYMNVAAQQFCWYAGTYSTQNSRCMW